MHKKIIVANWKMNPASVADAVVLAKKIEQVGRGISGTEIVLAPPALFLVPIARVLKSVRLGAQNAFWEDVGAYTGEVSPSQLRHIGVRYVVVGHSERKMYVGETDEMIAKKTAAVVRAGMGVILCIGERHRAAGDIPAEVGTQLKNALAGLKRSALKDILVCYEPVWAISTTPDAVSATPDDAFRASVYIRKIIGSLFGLAAGRETRVIYGGSVGAKNMTSFLDEGAMDGVLVGSASLDAHEFKRIITAVASS